MCLQVCHNYPADGKINTKIIQIYTFSAGFYECGSFVKNLEVSLYLTSVFRQKPKKYLASYYNIKSVLNNLKQIALNSGTLYNFIRYVANLLPLWGNHLLIILARSDQLQLIVISFPVAI